MEPVHADALRRLATTAAVLAATLGAHGLASGRQASTLATPLMAAVILGFAALPGRQAPQFRRRGFGRTLGTLLVFQAAAHSAVSTAPWLLGLTVHHTAVVPGAAMVLAHVAAALGLAVALTWLDRVLAGLVRVVAAVRRLLAPAPSRGRPALRLRPAARAPRPRLALRAIPARGPPLLAT